MERPLNCWSELAIDRVAVGNEAVVLECHLPICFYRFALPQSGCNHRRFCN
jgi:hypothetical protein